MSSIARYIASTRSKVIAKSSKVQYTNSIVSTDTLINGVIPCGRISMDNIFYKDKPICGVRKITNLIYDGGSPSWNGTIKYDVGSPFSRYDGGTTSSSGNPIYDGGNSSASGSLVYDGGSASSRHLIYDGGNALAGGDKCI